MLPHNDGSNTDKSTSGEVALMRQELHDLRQDILKSLHYLSAVVSAINGLRASQARMADHLGIDTTAIVNRNTQHCHACGGPVTRHPAEAGVLLLCSACGWSEFIDRAGRESSEVRPDSVPPSPQRNHWAA